MKRSIEKYDVEIDNLKRELRLINEYKYKKLDGGHLYLYNQCKIFESKMNDELAELIAMKNMLLAQIEAKSE